MRTSLTLAATAVALAWVLVWGRLDRPRDAVAGAAPERAASSTGERRPAPAPPPAALPSARTSLGDATGPAAASPAPLSEDELVDVLERLAAVREFAILFPSSLEEALAPIVLSKENAERVLALLRSGRLGGSVELTAAERGAVFALVMTAVLHSAEGDDPGLSATGIDGEVLLGELLELCGVVRERLRRHLLEQLAGTRPKDHPVLRTDRLAQILRLRVLYPQAADDYVGLIQRLSGELDADDRAALYGLYLSPQESARTSGVALARLLEGGEDPERLLAWAEEKLAAQPDPLARDALRRELNEAISAHAPPELAARFLARHGRPSDLAASLRVGSRPGGVAVLLAQYEDLLARGAPADARRRVVFGMAGADEDTLLAIARDDPDATVRGQALITLTLAAGYSPTAAEAVVSAWRRRGGPGAPDPYGTMLAAANLLLADSAEVRASGRKILIEAVHDTTLPDWLRSQALGVLSKHLSESELEPLRAAIEGG